MTWLFFGTSADDLAFGPTRSGGRQPVQPPTPRKSGRERPPTSLAWQAGCWLTRLLLAALPSARAATGPIDWGALVPPCPPGRGPWGRPQVLSTAPSEGAEGHWHYALTWAGAAAAGAAAPALSLPVLICTGAPGAPCFDDTMAAPALQPFPAAIAPTHGRPDTLRGFAHMLTNLAAYGRQPAGAAAARLTEAAVDQVHGSEALTTLTHGLEHLDALQLRAVVVALWLRPSPEDADIAATAYAAQTLYHQLMPARPLNAAHLSRMAGHGDHRLSLAPACRPLGAADWRFAPPLATFADGLALDGGWGPAAILADGGDKVPRLSPGRALTSADNARGLLTCPDGHSPQASGPSAGRSAVAVAILAQGLGMATDVAVSDLEGWKQVPMLVSMADLTLAEVTLDAATQWFELRDAAVLRHGRAPHPARAQSWGLGLDPSVAAVTWGPRLGGLVGALDAGLWRSPPAQRAGTFAPAKTLLALARLARGAPAEAEAANAAVSLPLPLANPGAASLQSRGWMDDALRLPSGETWQPRSARLTVAPWAGDEAGGWDGADDDREAVRARLQALARDGFNNLWLPLAAEPAARGQVLEGAAWAAEVAGAHFGLWLTLAPGGRNTSASLDLVCALASRLSAAPGVLLQPWGSRAPAAGVDGGGGEIDGLEAASMAAWEEARLRLRAAGYRQPIMGIDGAALVDRRLGLARLRGQSLDSRG